MPAGNLGLFVLAFGAVGRGGSRGSGRPLRGAGKGKSDAGGIDSDPATAPLLGDVGGGAGAAGGVDDEVARGRWS